MLGIGHGIVLHRIGFAQRGGCRVVRKQAVVVRGNLRECQRPALADDDLVAGGVVRVRAHQRLEIGLQPGLLALRQPLVRLAGRGTRGEIEHRQRLAVEPVGRPVRRDERAVAPDRAELLAPHALPHLAAALHVGPRVDHASAFGHHPPRERRRLLVHVAAHP
jgi:hypothetical protein